MLILRANFAKLADRDALQGKAQRPITRRFHSLLQGLPAMNAGKLYGAIGSAESSVCAAKSHCQP